MLQGAYAIVLRWYTQANISWRAPSTILDWICRVHGELGLACTITIALTLSFAIPVLTTSFHLSLPLSMYFGWGFVTAFQVALALVLTPVTAWVTVWLGTYVLWPAAVNILKGVRFMASIMVQFAYLIGRVALIDRMLRAAIRLARRD